MPSDFHTSPTSYPFLTYFFVVWVRYLVLDHRRHQLWFQCKNEWPYHLTLHSKNFLMAEHECYLICHSRRFSYLPPYHELVERQPSCKPELLYDQKGTPRDYLSPNECKVVIQINQHQQSLHGRNNTLMIPPPSSSISYFYPQPKSDPQSCSPLCNSCISLGCFH